jgi:hypothetical protein
VEHIDVLAQLVMFNNQDLHYMFVYFTPLSYARLLHTRYNKKMAHYFFHTNTVGKTSTMSFFIYKLGKYLHGVIHRIIIHRVSSHVCVPSLRLGLGLCIVREKKDLNLITHLCTMGILMLKM